MPLEETDGEFLSRLGVDGHLWAKEFIKMFGEKKDAINEELMVVWFSNAIMAGWDRVKRLSESKETKHSPESRETFIPSPPSFRTLPCFIPFTPMIEIIPNPTSFRPTEKDTQAVIYAFKDARDHFIRFFDELLRSDRYSRKYVVDTIRMLTEELIKFPIR